MRICPMCGGKRFVSLKKEKGQMFSISDKTPMQLFSVTESGRWILFNNEFALPIVAVVIILVGITMFMKSL